MTRVNDEHAWPVKMHSWRDKVRAVFAISTSSRTTAADFPPNSSVHRATRSAQIAPIRRPAVVDPVKVILSTRGSRTSCSETCRSAVRTLRTPGGNPTDSATSASTYASAGASGEDLRMTVQPAINADATLYADQAHR